MDQPINSRLHRLDFQKNPIDQPAYFAHLSNNPQLQTLDSIMKLKSLFLASILFAGIANADTGVFGSYIGINPNGAGNTWYGAQQWGANSITSFDGAFLGTIDLTGTLEISGFQVQTFKSGTGDVSGVELQYRVYPVSGTPDSFNIVSGGFLSNATFTSAAGNDASGSGDQNWGVDPTASLGNLIAGLTTPGDYEVDLFFRAFTNEGDRFSNNGGNNFTATFTLIPEPSTAVLGGLGMLALLRRRRA